MKEFFGMDGIKQKINRIPGVPALKREVRARGAGIRLSYERKEIDRRLAEKRKTGEKINAIFVCHRPAVWGALRSVYDALAANDHFNVTIVAIPNKKELPELWLNHEVYESEGAEDFWKEYDCINGYNYETKQWLDLKTLEPDYVFFQQPYNITRCKAYRSEFVSKYAKICYVSYFAPCQYGDLYNESLPRDFLKDVSYIFTQNTVDDRYVRKLVKTANGGMTKVCLTGYPKYDYAKEYAASYAEKKEKDDLFRIIWTPRWTTNEGLCHFFDYKDKILEYCQSNPRIDLTFRPHPQAYLEWESTGEFIKEEREKYLKLFDESRNLHVDTTRNYYPLLYSSSCLLTDMSSIVFDYLLTGNPIVLCMEKERTDFYEDIGDGLYRVSSWEELSEILSMLAGGKDPLQSVRKQIISERMHISKEGAGKKIAEILAADANGLSTNSALSIDDT